LVTLLLVGLAAFGLRPLRERWPAGAATALTALAGGSFFVAALGVLPGSTAVLEWAVREVPGAGLLRDGQKFIIPYALGLVLAAALGAERLTERLAPARAQLVLCALVLLPVVAMPDLAVGAFGTLRPVSYPEEWNRVAALVAADPGPVLAMPFNEYRSFAWNRRRTTLEPATRYLPAPVLVDDDLIVGTTHIAGENPQAAQVRALLTAGRPVSETGVRWVLVERDAGGSVPSGALSGLRLIYTGESLDLYANPDALPAAPPDLGRRWLISVADVLALLAFSLAIASLFGLPTPW
jgi:hypothetical protein